MRELRERIAAVTGAASGIGRALAVGLAAQGMHVAIADVDTAGLAATADAVRASGRRALAVPTDVRDAAAVARFADAVVAEFGAVHVVCNNAGVSRMGLSWEVPLEDWNWVLDVAFWGVVHGIRAFVPHLLAHDEPGHVVNTSSVGGLAQVPYIAPYTAAKHAVVGLTRSLRAELAGTAVGVSLLCPGPVVSNMDPHTPRPGEVEHLADGPAALAEHARGSHGEGMPAEHVARMTVTAIQEDQFYVLPNLAGFLPALESDFSALLSAPTR
ncbi:SDR family NAD(P)-dependent oxidoreductase [Amycolatopsis jiangsuensis]|uniref:NAD(P)-dependent dehydrogenase (Short-subunit alcohol dehydrogenase family) n=1 Tax=Amycolatopsis jiangsuensis TaxID=1181879 RepID=A0A840INJ3_9PSEU|nr:SDR family NAD(P)-dependent oxidoreductase [Amycolatopsis jiangsuensis]MBB4682644.1 NAD(P)-dependent dehydrogenase (short-subunit alcohol dehydrogenase family) [Amycolatopsis jiangsuensis]